MCYNVDTNKQTAQPKRKENDIMKTYRIGNKICFSKQGAIDCFKLFAKRCYENLTMESSCVLSDVADDLHRELGLSYNEIEAIEISCMA